MQMKSDLRAVCLDPGTTEVTTLRPTWRCTHPAENWVVKTALHKTLPIAPRKWYRDRVRTWDSDTSRTAETQLQTCSGPCGRLLSNRCFDRQRIQIRSQLIPTLLDNENCNRRPTSRDMSTADRPGHRGPDAPICIRSTSSCYCPL